MRHRFGWNGHACAEALGCGINSIWEWSKKGAPLYVALACAAIERNVSPWELTDEASMEFVAKETDMNEIK